MSNSFPEMHAEAALTALRTHLSAVTPYLFNLSDQVIAAAPEAEWDMIICDDVGGRLPTRFISNTLQNSGYDIPIGYVAGSRFHHEKFGNEAYEEHFRSLAASIGKPVLNNVLVMTEITGRGDTMHFLADRLRSVASKIETAAVVNKHPELMSTTYVGAASAAAARDIYYAFETLPLSRAQKIAKTVLPNFVVKRVGKHIQETVQPYNPLLGLGVTDYGAAPITNRVSEVHRSQSAYAEMDALAELYVAGREQRIERYVS